MSLAATVLIPTHDHGPTLLPLGAERAGADGRRARGARRRRRRARRDARADGRAVAADERVRFFDNPKGQRHGEIHRHAALQEARGEIVCYLSRRRRLAAGPRRGAAAAARGRRLRAHALVLRSTGELLHVMRLDLSRDYFRQLLLGGESRIHLSITGHTLAHYRRLPDGWQPTPAGHLHRPLFLAAAPRAARARARRAGRGRPCSTSPALRAGWSQEQRLAELDALGRAAFPSGDAAPARQRPAGPRGARRGAVAGSALAGEPRRQGLAETSSRPSGRQLQAIADSATWRLRGASCACRGLRSAARALAGRAAPRAAEPRVPLRDASRARRPRDPQLRDRPSGSQLVRRDPSTR